MGFEKYDTKLIKTSKGIKTIVIVFGVIWLVIVSFLLGTQMHATEKEGFQLTTIVPILVVPITIHPIFINYQNFKKKKLKEEDFSSLYW